MGEVVEARLPGIARLLPPIAAYPAGPLLTGALRALARRKPGLFDRLGEYSKERYVIDPSDLGFAFTIVPDRERSFVSVVGKSDVAKIDAAKNDQGKSDAGKKDDAPAAEGAPEEGAKVVSLSAFRKKP